MTVLAILVFGIMCMFVGCIACMKLYVELSKNQTRVYGYGWLPNIFTNLGKWI